VAEDEPKLKRGVFGYTSRSIQSLLDDQMATFRLQMGTQARLAKEKSADLQAQLGRSKQEIDALTQELRSHERRRTDLQAKLDAAHEELRIEKEQIGVLRSSIAELGEQVRAASEVVDERNDAIASAANLEAELSAVRDELRMKALESWSVEQENIKLREQVAALLEERPPKPEPAGVASDETSKGDPMAALVTHELSSALDQVVAEVVRRIRRSSVEQLEEAQDLRREAGAELERLVVLRDATAPLIRSVQGGMRRAQASIDELPHRVADAVAPLTASLAALADPIRGMAEAMTADPDTSGASPTIELPESDHLQDPAVEDPGLPGPAGSSEPWIPPR
jgi:hypothetical protein